MPKKNAKKSSKGKEIQAPETQSPPSIEGKRIPKALQAVIEEIGPNGTPVLPKPHGKLANTDLPEGYEKPQLECQAITESDNVPDDYERFTTIPPNSDAPGRQTECIMTGRAKNRLYACAPFLTEHVPKPRPNTIITKESPTGGSGIFAGRDIHYGELLIAERPLLITPVAIRYRIRGGAEVDDYTHEDHVKIMLFEQERLLQVAFNRMDEDRKEAYMALVNSHKEDGSGPLLGIQRTNGFGIDLNELTKNDDRAKRIRELANISGGIRPSEEQQEKLKPQENPDFYSVIAKDASRMNHSCSPNADFEFSLASFSLQVYAVRDIKSGEEIFYSYTGVQAPAAERRKALKPYGFTCACKACSLATPESDKFRQNSSKHIQILETLFRSLIEHDRKHNNGMQSLRETILPNVLKFRRKLKEEGLDAMAGPYLSSTILLRDLYSRLGVTEGPEYQSLMRDLATWMLIKGGLLAHFMSPSGNAEHMESTVAAIAQGHFSSRGGKPNGV